MTATMASPRFSLIIPTFKRPDEVEECLESLCLQTNKNFEVIIADGTPVQSLQFVADRYLNRLPLVFLYEEFLGVSEARNLGFQHARGEYIIFLDSDCIIPPHYIENVIRHLDREPLDLFGGPDAAADSFTVTQKAISYSMTSLLTTGGIRGQKKHVGQYHPRSFNMGMRKIVFETVNGFSDFKCGEDIELSIRIIKAGFKAGLIEDAYVYHKRRANFKQFYHQVFRFGAARINIGSRHPGEIKLTHLFPLAFSAGLVFSLFLTLILPCIGKYFLLLYGLYFLALFLHSSLENKSLKVGAAAVVAAAVQFAGYGYGMLRNGFAVYIQGKKQGIPL
jgi:GT2 family glycosyltransferase